MSYSTAHSKTTDPTDTEPTPNKSAPGNATPRERRPGAPILQCLDNIKPESVSWLWPGRIARGKITVLAGEPGLGKSMMSLDTAARVSRGSVWPDGIANKNGPGGVVLFAAEDDVADTLVPRLDSMGADRSRIHHCCGVACGGAGVRQFTLDDLVPLTEAVDSVADCQLVVVDPVSSFTKGGKGERAEALRRMLSPIAEMAAERDIAVLLVTHLAKGGKNPLDRVMGSRALTALARAVWLVMKDPTDSGQRLLLPGKLNIAPDTSGLAFRIEGEPPRVVWSPDSVTTTPEEAAKGAPGHSGESAVDEAIAWLRDLLANGPVAVNEIKRLAEEHDLAWRTIERAKAALKIDSTRSGFGGPWIWRWPEDRHGCSNTAKSATRVCVTRNEPVLALLPG